MTEQSRYQDWIGRAETALDVLDPVRVAALNATIGETGKPMGMPAAGDPLPPGAQWLYFWPLAPMSEVGPDGHPKRGGFLPPVSLPKRMWAGGRLRFHQPLIAGAQATRRSEILSVSGKDGRSGPLVFVTVAHEFLVDGSLCLREEHDIVYRDDAPASRKPAAAKDATTDPAAEAPGDIVARRAIDPDPVMLFRYSALTFNGHRIHYDRDYCRDVEGYPGLIVHGPLIATFLMDLCRREGPAPLTEFEFRALRPLFDGERFETIAVAAPDGGWALRAARPGKAPNMTATARFGTR
ncbi:FAS1-like dehydratase domain-containing protein [Oceanibacterium hippocampi]|uniref:FAS1-like dehydratase domain-containing protein n=1 Tax=Oceanibacterium hippocampi TaxID=745714 RepID=A0A1Y5R929_9PROT|nr:MaoC family dehydratase N-terminal domain-containing protein [Oceanibacterium hippocampi]SLN11992.1 hypothetical protein OCH7691_00118 [Oceanibacterium hippocampi]